MDIRRYLSSASSVVSSSSDSDSTEFGLMYNPILLRSTAQVLLLNHLPSQDLESGDTTKSEKELFPG